MKFNIMDEVYLDFENNGVDVELEGVIHGGKLIDDKPYYDVLCPVKGGHIYAPENLIKYRNDGN